MEQILEKKVKTIVTDDYRAAAVFEKYGIDFCCNGGKALGAACSEQLLDPSRILQELQQFDTDLENSGSRPTEWELDALVDHIVNTHHAYVARMLPVLHAHLQKVIDVHGRHHSELAEIGSRFEGVSQELSAHMKKEEIVLFPYIKSLAGAERIGSALHPPSFGTIRNPIRMMEYEHQEAGHGFAAMRTLSKGFTPPSDACTTYTVLYRELNEFEQDLHRHIHLENNILFPRAIDLEDRIVKR